MNNFQDKIISYVISGFDSAWTDKIIEPGAIASIIQYEDGLCNWVEPELTTFAEAQKIIIKLSKQSKLHLVAIDQPIVVPNLDSCRPVDRVAASLISKLKGGAQPANRSKENMFGDNAPIWKLLNNIPHKQLPWMALKNTLPDQISSQQIIIEVFPALALPSLIPYFFERGIGAKYNPANKKKFNIKDWIHICEYLEEFGEKHNIEGLAQWAKMEKMISMPSKSDQDKLDAAICTLIGYCWHIEGIESNLIIGDEKLGYMITPITPETRCILSIAANKNNVPINRVWNKEVEFKVSDNLSNIPSKQFEPKVNKQNVKNKLKIKQKADLSTKEYQCPIGDCGKIFKNSRAGWDSHVESTKIHPNWYPEINEGNERKKLFKHDFPDWFK